MKLSFFVLLYVVFIENTNSDGISFSNLFGRNESDPRIAPYQNSNNSEYEIITINLDTLDNICFVLQVPLNECTCEQQPDLCAVNSDFLPVFVSYPVANLTLAILTSICLLFGIVGNSSVLLVSFHKRKNLTRSKKLFTQLAVVDLTSSVVIFISTVHFYWTSKWVFGANGCKFINSIAGFGILLPIGYILIIALERFLAIFYPMWWDLRGEKVTYFCLALNVIFGLVTIIPFFSSLNINEFGICEEIWPAGRKASLIYHWFLMVFYFIVPVGITAVLYGIIMRYLSRELQANTLLDHEETTQKQHKKNRRTMIILVSVLVGFIISVLPTRICFLVSVYADRIFSSKAEVMAISFVNNLTYPLHVIINPIIYSVTDREWRKDLISILGWRRGHLRQKFASKSSTTQASIDLDDQSTNKPLVLEGLQPACDRNDTKV